ncbi:DUF1501 domain-containing protein [Nannocystis sp. RBIL2]|uniref:DUF1501 domain-containing protein n=1 Tax=Nannocystis sp. RBIL2 TaxID=2996788 RepID=UPI00227211BF|nr:DUF1501 domain-containing protein [Nannocystis sp. RBIL2]MCY1063948.1 DUF1501 domain-containing protein [Nannocystis sp. RBIL2]
MSEHSCLMGHVTSDMSRRTWLKRGFYAVAAAGALAGGRRLAAAEPGPARRLVLVLVQGGWDTTYAIDPKPGLGGVDSPAGAVKEFHGLDVLTDPARPAVGAFFDAWGDRCAVVRGVSVASVAHPDCMHRILTGVLDDTAPDVAAIAAATHAPDLPAPYLILGRTAYSGPYGALSARTGSVNQIVTLLDPQLTFPALGAPLLPLVPSDGEEALIRAHVELRAERELAAAKGSKRVQDFLDALPRGDLLRDLGEVGELELTRTFDTQVKLAVEALRRGLCHSVQIESGDWDTHTGNDAQGPKHEALFKSLAGLMQSLAAAGLLDDTAVVVASEMGRTPRLNAAQGKDHWPITSTLVLGAGVAGGKVVGATTDALDAAPIDFTTGAIDPKGRPIAYADLAAGLLELVGVDPSAHIPTGEPLHAISA